MRYCGREFTEHEIQWLCRLMAREPEISRHQVSLRFCKQFGWLKPDGGLKDMSCRVALLRMERDGLLRLPPRKKGHDLPRKQVKRTLLADPQPEIRISASRLDLVLEVVDQNHSVLWNEFIDRYHYLGYKPLPGAQLRYFVKANGRLLALLGFGAAAWKTAPRDGYIGWTPQQRENHLHLVVNNARFLILPWVKSRNLASRILSLVSKRLLIDWEGRYNYRPVLLESFVEKERFEGTCYKAAGWICVGETQGRGKLDVHKEYKLPVKTIWLYPLRGDFQSLLCGGRFVGEAETD